jgi:predicted MFS family arabinose efflux permease
LLTNAVNSYAAVLRTPYALRTVLPALVGRLSYGIVFVCLAVALTRATGSYGWAGGALAGFGLAVAALAPVRARLIDRYGPRRVLPVMACAYAALLTALAAAAWQSAGRGLLLGLTVVAGTCAPPLGPTMRVLWNRLVPDAELRQRAYSLDTVAEELLFVCGPLLAGAFIAVGRPAAGVVASAVLVVCGTAGVVSSPALSGRCGMSADEAAVRDGRRQLGRGVVLPVLLAGSAGASLGALSLLIVAFANRHQQLTAVAWAEAGLAVGSVVGGLAYGARAWRAPLRVRLPLLAVGLGATQAAAGLAPAPLVLVFAVAAVGVWVAPTLTSAYLAADEAAPENARTRAGTWVNSAFNAGNAAGTAAIGLAVGRWPLTACFVAAAAVPLAAGTAAALPGLLRECGRLRTVGGGPIVG